MPRVVKFVFWRLVPLFGNLAVWVDAFYSILLFYILSILLIGLNGERLPRSQILTCLILNHSSLGLPKSL
jgi:hypothetical protein